MKCNVGVTDKMIRIILGAIILAAGIFYSSWWGILGAILILTGIFKFCALYSIFGISTCSMNDSEKK